MKRKIEMVMAVFFIAISLMASVWGVSVVSAKKTAKNLRVVIDPGHGGSDPGKVAEQWKKMSIYKLHLP